MSNNLKTALCFVVIFVAIGLVGRWDFEDEVATSAITFSCTPADHIQSPARVRGHFHDRDLSPAVYRPTRKPADSPSVLVYRCVRVN